MAPEFVTISNLIIDDIVLSDGRTFLNTLGGAGTHTLVGMRPWSAQLGFVAYCGDDLAPAHVAYLDALGIDRRGILVRPGEPTPRAWQRFEHGDERIEIFQTSLEEYYQLRPHFSEIPADYLQARGYHLQWGKPEDMLHLIEQLRAANPTCVLICEPTLPSWSSPMESSQPILSAVDVYSPDRTEAQILTGSDDITTIFERLLGGGARTVALRMGAAGSLVGTAAGAFYRVPAVPPAALVDVTGAGNAYCGGFLVGIGRGEEMALAAARATVSASFAIEQFAVPTFDEAKLAEAERRLAWALPRIEMSTDLARFLPIA